MLKFAAADAQWDGGAALTDTSETRMGDKLSADEVRVLLKLEPHPTCGFVRETFRSIQSIAADALPAPLASARPLGSALYFMVTPRRTRAASPDPERPALPLLSR
jgi:hypothetical protein